jgi:hypothetical protein
VYNTPTRRYPRTVATTWNSVPHLDMMADLSEETFGVRSNTTAND